MPTPKPPCSRTINIYLPKWLVEGHRVDHVLVLGQVQQLLARHRVPNFAGSIIGARDEFVACLVECAIG